MDNEHLKYNEIAEMLKALAHPIRFCIVVNLLNKGDSNVTNMQDCLKIPQSTLSQHLQTLRNAKLIEGTRNGLEVNYHVISDDIEDMIKAILAVKTK